jgi:glucose-1-phosphate thymidylyltransferase
LASSSIKIIIPMAGYGTRLRPLTWSRPKPLIRLADKLMLDHVLDMLSSLPDLENSEFIFIVGKLGEKIEAYMHQAHPNLHVTYIQQPEMRGQSHAIALAKEYLTGPMVMVYVDTLIETNFSFLSTETADGVAWVKAVPDPRRFGVASLGADGRVDHLIEKPPDMDNNLAVVGCYYLRSSEDLLHAIDEQIQRNISLKGEFFLTDAINIMLEHGLKMRVEYVETWLDAGTLDDILSTNRYLLEHGHANMADALTHKDAVFLPPVYIHPSASIKSSVIGPYAVIGAGCKVMSSIIRDSIIDDGSDLSNVVLEHSLVGREVEISSQADVLNVGDHSKLSL